MREELGLDLTLGALLVVDWTSAGGARDDQLTFVYDGGVLADLAAVVLQADELRSARFVPATTLDAVLPVVLAHRMHAARAAVATGSVAEDEQQR